MDDDRGEGEVRSCGLNGIELDWIGLDWIDQVKVRV
jgi:hypothetical protein